MVSSGDAEAEWVIRHWWFPEDSIVQSYVQYAWDISNGDMDFITTLEAENGLRNPQRQSEVRKNGVREDSRGFCQLHRAWHSAIVDDARFKTDPYWQLEQCYNKYLAGTKFYWYFVRHWLEKRFSFDGTYVEKKKLTVEQSIPTSNNTYWTAKLEQEQADKAREIAKREKREAEEARNICKVTGECNE